MEFDVYDRRFYTVTKYYFSMFTLRLSMRDYLLREIHVTLY